jgi:hypothetical protein
MVTMTDTPGMASSSGGLRLEVVELLCCFDPRNSLWPAHLVHLDGRPYTPQENALVAGATEEEHEMARALVKAGDEADQKRYDDVMGLVQTGSQARVPSDDARAFRAAVAEKPLPPNITVNELNERAAEEAATVVSAFRAHILPHLDGRERGQALYRLNHLDPMGTTPSERGALKEFIRSRVTALERLKELMGMYEPTRGAPLHSYWDSIPESARAEMRPVIREAGWAVPGAEDDGDDGVT